MIRLSKEEHTLFEQIHSSIKANKYKEAEEIEKAVKGVLGGRQISLRLAGAVIKDVNTMYFLPAKDLICDVAIRAFDPEVVRKGIDDDKIAYESNSQRIVSVIIELYKGGSNKVQKLWNKLKLNHASYDERLVLYEAINKLGSSYNFAVFIEDVAHCSSLEERLDRCRDLSQADNNSVEKHFLQHFHKLGFIDDLNNYSNPEQRLQICERIASLGPWAAMGLAATFDKLGLEDASLQQRIAFCHTLTAQGPKAEEAVTTHLFTILELIKEIERCTTIRERLDFCKRIAQEGGWAARKLAATFDKLGLEKASLEERLELFRTIVEQGDDAEKELISHFSYKLGMTNFINKCKEINDRLDICLQIVQQGRWGAHAIANFFNAYSLDKLGLKKLPWQKRLSLFREIMHSSDKKTQGILSGKLTIFGFIDDINQCSNPEESLKLCRELICADVGCCTDSTDLNLAYTEFNLAYSLSELDFVKKIADNDCKQRFALSMTLTQLGPWCAEYVTRNFFELKLNELSADQRFALYMAIAQQGAHVSWRLAKYFIDLPKKMACEGFTPQQRCDLYVEIVQRKNGAADFFGGAADFFAPNFDKLGLDGDEAKALRLRLSIAIAKKDNSSALSLLNHFKNLGLQDISVPERHHLCLAIVKHDRQLTEKLIAKRSDIGLHNESPQQQTTLWMAMARQNKDVAKTLAENLSLLALDKRSLITLATTISNMGVSVWSDWFAGDDTLKRELFFIFSAPPSHVRLVDRHISSNSYLEVVAALVPLLTKDENDTFSDEEIKSLETFITTNAKLKKPLGRLLSSLLDELKPKEPPKPQPTALIRWLAHAAARLNDLDGAQIVLIEKSTLLEGIYKTQLPLQRYLLLNGLIYLAQRKPEKLATFENLKPKDKPPAKASLLIQPLREDGFSDDGLNVLFKKITERSKMFKDSRKLDALLQLFSAVAANGPYSDEEAVKMVKIVEKIFDGKKKGEKEVMRDLQICTNLLQLFGKEEFLIDEKEPQAIFQEKFVELFDVSGRVPKIAEAYQETIAKFRNPTALFTYWRAINKLKGEKKREVNNTLNDYVAAVLMGTFPAVRYNDEAVAKSRHLETLFAYDSNVKAKWLEKADPKPLFLNTEKKEPLFDAKKFLRHEIIDDRHLEPDLLPRLVDFLDNKPVGEPGDPKNPTERFEDLAITFCKGELTTQKFVDEVKKLKDLALSQAFRDNLDSLLEMRTATGDYYQIEESDDACDLLLIGTEIQGSCQRVDGCPNLNKGLAAYLMNGEIRAIAIKKGGKLVARSIMRLLWDSKRQSPILLLERPYKNVRHSAIDDAIKGWAVNKAKAMGIPLVSKEFNGDGENEPYDGTVELFGGYAPFTYSDAAGGIIPKTQHTTIQGVHLLYAPASSLPTDYD